MDATQSAALHMDPLLPLLVGAAAVALLVGGLARRLGQPHVIGYLLCGVVLGPHGMDLFQDVTTVSRLGELGVVLLLFFVGMEVSLERLVRGWRVAVIGTLLQVALTVGIIGLLGWGLDWSLARVVLVGFAVALSSTAVVVSLLRSRGELETDAGRDALGILLAQDLALIPMLVVLGFLAGERPTPGELGLQALGATVLTGVLVYAARHQGTGRTRAWMATEDHELEVFAAFLVCFGFAWISGVTGLSTAMGAFVAGVLMASRHASHWVHRSLEPLRVLFVALFFVSVGMLIDLRFLWQNLGLVLALVAATLVLNTALNAVILRLLGRRRNTSLRVAAMLAQAGEFSFVVAFVGQRAGILSDFGHQAILAMIALSLAVSPAWIALITRLVGAPSPIGPTPKGPTPAEGAEP